MTNLHSIFKSRDRSPPQSGPEAIRSRSAVTGRVGSMVSLCAAPEAGAFLSEQAVFHGRELLAELPLFTMDFGQTRSVEGMPKRFKVSLGIRVWEITDIFYKRYPSIR